MLFQPMAAQLSKWKKTQRKKVDKKKAAKSQKENLTAFPHLFAHFS